MPWFRLSKERKNGRGEEMLKLPFKTSFSGSQSPRSYVLSWKSNQSWIHFPSLSTPSLSFLFIFPRTSSVSDGQKWISSLNYPEPLSPRLSDTNRLVFSVSTGGREGSSERIENYHVGPYSTEKGSLLLTLTHSLLGLCVVAWYCNGWEIEPRFFTCQERVRNFFYPATFGALLGLLSRSIIFPVSGSYSHQVFPPLSEDFWYMPYVRSEKNREKRYSISDYISQVSEDFLPFFFSWVDPIQWNFSNDLSLIPGESIHQNSPSPHNKGNIFIIMPSPLALNPDLNFHLRKIESPQIEIGITIEPRKSEGMAKKSSVRNGTIIFTRSNSADFTKTPRSKQILLDLFFKGWDLPYEQMPVKNRSQSWKKRTKYRKWPQFPAVFTLHSHFTIRH